MSTTTSSQRERNFDDLLRLLQGALRAHLARPRDRAPLRQALKLLAEIDLRLGPSGPRDVAALCQEMVRLVAGLAQGLIAPSQEGAYLLARAALEIPSQSEMDGDHHGHPLKLLTRELQALREDHGRTRSVASPPSAQNDPARSPLGHTFCRSGEHVVHKPDLVPLDGNPFTRTSVAEKGFQSPRVAVTESSAPEIGTGTAPASRKSNPESRESTERHIHPRLADYHKFTSPSKETASPTSRTLQSEGITAAENEWVDALDDARCRFQAALLLVCRAPDARAAAGQLVAISAEIAAALPGTGCGSLFDSTKRLAADIVRTGAEPSPSAKRLLGRVDRQLGRCLRSFRQLSENSERSARRAAWKVPADLIIAVRDAVAAPGNMATAWSRSSGPSNPVSDHTRNQSTNREQFSASCPRPNSSHNHGVRDQYSGRLYEQKPGIPERSGRPQAAPRPTAASKQERNACRQPHPREGALHDAGDVVSRLGSVFFLLVLAPFRFLVFSGGLLAYLVKELIVTGWLVVQGIGEILYLTATSIVRVIIWTTSGIADGAIAAGRGVSASLRALAHAIVFVARGTAHGCVATAFGIAWILGTAAREIAFAVAATALAIIAPIAAVGRNVGRSPFISGRSVSRIGKFLKSVTDEALSVTGRWILRSASRTAHSNEQHHGLRLSAFLQLVFPAPGKLLTISVHQLTRLLKRGQPVHAGSRRDTGSVYTIPRPALALAFLGGLGISALTVSNVLHETKTVDSIAHPGEVSVNLNDRMAHCDIHGQHHEPIPHPGTHSAHDCPPSAARSGTESFSDQPIQIASHGGNGESTRVSEGADKTPDQSSLQAHDDDTPLNLARAPELAAKARQLLRDHRYLTLLDSPGPDGTPENTLPAIRLASLLGPDSDLASALIAAASATPATRDITVAVSDASRLQRSHPTPADDEAVRLSPTRVSDSVPDSNIVFAVWEPSLEHTTAARSRTRSRPETRRATTTTDSASLVPVSRSQPAHDNVSRKPTTEARLQRVVYSETNSSKGETPNTSQAFEIASIGPFLPHLDSLTAPAPSLSTDGRDLERRIEASLERNQRLLPTSYQLLDLDLDPARPSGLMWNNHTLREGDSVAALWSSVWKLPPAVLYRILADSESALLLNRVHPGQEVAWQTDANGELVRLRLWHDRVSGTEWILNDGGQGFVRNDVMKKREVQHIALTAQVDEDIATSLAARPELSASATRSLTILLERHLPMHDDKVQPGDRFALLIEQEMIEGDDTPYEVRLLAFDYRGEKIDLTAIRNTDGRFYTPDGKSLLPSFERTPFVGSYRVSSAYNLRRRHPVTGRTAPHHGTDFSMPVGTPIMAPADGKVTHVHTHPHAGRYLVVEHGQGYTTRYLHLQRTFVRSGQTVKRGERIALSGNTGRTTGPHLHYELHVDGVPVDAMRAELPAAKSLAGIHLEQFQNNAQPLLAALRNADPSQQLAMRPFPGLDR